jgi:hypothetical protein
MSVRKFKLLKEGSDVTLANFGQGPCRKKMATSLTMTLAVLTSTFIVLTLPLHADILWKYEHIGDGGDSEVDAELEGRSELCYAIFTLMWYTNSAVNFFLYCLSGTKFRREFHRWALRGGRIRTVLRTKVRVHFQRRGSSETTTEDSGLLCQRLRFGPCQPHTHKEHGGEQAKDGKPAMLIRVGLLSPMYCAASPSLTP